MDLIELKQVQHNFKRHPWEQTRLKVLLFMTRKFIRHKKVIADIGSGDAFIAKSLASTFPQSSVLAVDIHYTQEIKASIQEKALNNISFVSDLHFIEPKTSAPINLLILMDVLEHIENPGAFLNEIKQLNRITRDTFVFITVPAFQSLFTKHDTLLGHYKRYSRKELNRLVEAQGLQIRHSGYFFTSLLVVRALQKLLRKDPSKDGLYNWKGSPLLTSLITGFFWMEFKISWYLSRLRIPIPGLTCYCLCHPLPS